jgi:hypothetical protein
LLTHCGTSGMVVATPGTAQSTVRPVVRPTRTEVPDVPMMDKLARHPARRRPRLVCRRMQGYAPGARTEHQR